MDSAPTVAGHQAVVARTHSSASGAEQTALLLASSVDNRSLRSLPWGDDADGEGQGGAQPRGLCFVAPGPSDAALEFRTSARQLSRLCQEHDAYRWITGASRSATGC